MTPTREPDHTAADSWVCIGKIGRPHGVKGEFHLQSFTEDPSRLFAFDEIRLGPGREPVKLHLIRPVQNGFVARADGFGDRTAVDALRNKELFARRDSFPAPADDTFYQLDLVGLEAREADGKTIGTIVAVHDFGAGNILEIRLNQSMKNVGNSLMLPFTEALVPKVNIEAGFVITQAREWLAEDIVANPEGGSES